MSNLKKLGFDLLVLATISTSFLSSANVYAKSPLSSDRSYNVVVSEYADLAIRYKNTLLDPFYVPALAELSPERTKFVAGSQNNALFVFPDKNGDYLFRVSIVPKDYKLGESIDDIKSMKATKGPLMKSYFTTDALNQIDKVVVYYIPAAKQADFKANTIVRFTTKSGKIYSMSMNRLKANPGIKVQFNSIAPSTENLKRQESATENKITFYK
jgi:hypothetical protein